MAMFFQTWHLDVFAVAVSLLAVLIAYFKRKFAYWERRGVQALRPAFPAGNVGGVLTGKEQFSEICRRAYQLFKDKGLKHCGFYTFAKAVYMPIDIEIVKGVMQKDFQHFVNHGTYFNEKDDPIGAHLFALEDAKWRNLRVKLTPTFTSGRLKAMFQILVDCGEELKLQMDDYSKGKPLDIKDILGRFTTDIIGSCAFGLDCNTLNDPNSEFRKYGKRVFEVDTLQLMRGFAQLVLPRSFLNKIGARSVRPDVSEFFTNIVRQTVEYRERNKVRRKDFMDLLLQLKNRGKLSEDGKTFDDGDVSKETALTMDELSAQAFVFFAAGFETSSTTMTWALYELATNPDVQKKLRDEIREALEKHDNKVSYEALNDMKYMDMVINETLRKYPPIGILTRVSNSDYKVPGTDLLLEKGTLVFIPVMGIHKDPEYYPEPESFIPERFSEENKSKRPPFTFLPFGEGPRMCIGLRFGIMQTKVGLAAILRKYSVSMNEKTATPMVLDPRQFITTAKGGVWLNVTKL